MNIGERSDHKNSPLPAGQKVTEKQNEDEARRIRRLQVMMSMVTSVISQDPALTVEEASELAAGANAPPSPCSPTKN